MLAAILALLTLPLTDVGRSRGMQFRPLSKLIFFIFIADFILLGILGAKHVESPYIEIGQISTFLYFSFFAVLLPLSSYIENTLVYLGTRKK